MSFVYKMNLAHYRAAYRMNRRRVFSLRHDQLIWPLNPGCSEHSRPWQSITGVGQDSKITVFCAKAGTFLFFPTSALTSEQRAELDELVSRHRIRRWS